MKGIVKDFLVDAGVLNYDEAVGRKTDFTKHHPKIKEFFETSQDVGYLVIDSVKPEIMIRIDGSLTFAELNEINSILPIKEISGGGGRFGSWFWITCDSSSIFAWYFGHEKFQEIDKKKRSAI